MNKVHYNCYRTSYSSVGTACGVYVNELSATTNPLEVTCKNCQRSVKYKEEMKKLNKKSKETKMEKSYVERQAEWVRENKLEVGDKVLILRKAESYEDGWGTTWEPEMDVYVEVAGEVTLVDGVVGVSIEFSNGSEYFFPYFVLVKVTEAEPKKVNLLAQLEEICGEGWVHTIVENYENGHLIISEATWQDKPYLNLHTLDYEHTIFTTIVIDGVEAMERLRDILDKQIKEYKEEV